jgi:poly(3-hydroxybutyrate) depolymerase
MTAANASTRQVDETLPVGSGQFDFADPRPGPPRVIRIFTYRPQTFTPEGHVLVVMHGRKRDGAAYRDGWIPPAQSRGFLVVVPQFSEADYPTSYDYNYGNMMTAQGEPVAPDQWLFPVIDQVFDAARARAGARRETYKLFGHSAGGQFVHRLLTFAWSARIEDALSANAGSYTMPLYEEQFPFGLGGTTLREAQLPALFGRPLTILLGDRDNDPDHYQLPREPGAMRQGPHRFARGHHYFEVARREAARLGAPFAWKLGIAPGVAHSNPHMAPFAAEALFG